MCYERKEAERERQNIIEKKQYFVSIDANTLNNGYCLFGNILRAAKTAAKKQLPSNNKTSAAILHTVLLQLLKKVLRLEVVGNGLVVAGDNFVNLFLPGGLGVPAHLDRVEELAQRCLHHRAKVVRHLK